jgi:hypothetical protein
MKAKILLALKNNSVEKTINGSVTGCILENNYGTVINEIVHLIDVDSYELKTLVRKYMYQIEVANPEVRKGNANIRQSAMDVSDVVVNFYKFALRNDIERL